MTKRIVLFVWLSVGMMSLALIGEEDPRVVAESKKANDFFERVYNEKVDRYPEWQTYLGIKKDYGEWDDGSEEMELRELAITKGNMEWLQSSIDYDLLDEQTKISYRLAIQNAKDAIANLNRRGAKATYLTCLSCPNWC